MLLKSLTFFSNKNQHLTLPNPYSICHCLSFNIDLGLAKLGLILVLDSFPTSRLWAPWMKDLGPSQFFYLPITSAQDKCSFDLQYKTKKKKNIYIYIYTHTHKTKKSTGTIQGRQISSAKTPNWPPNRLKYSINIYFSLSRVPCSPPGAIPDWGIKPASLASPALAGGFFITSATWEALNLC